MEINIIIATLTSTGEILFAEGIEDGYNAVQVIVPKKYITEADSKKFHKYDKQRYDKLEDHENYNLGENEAKDITYEWELINIEIIVFDVGTNVAALK